MRISQAILDAIVRHAEDQQPHMAAGAILEAPSGALEFVPLTNTLHSAFRFQVPPAELDALRERVRGGETLLAFTESHRGSLSARPSSSHRDLDQEFPELRRIVIALGRDPPEARAWQATRIGPQEEPLEIAGDLPPPPQAPAPIQPRTPGAAADVVERPTAPRPEAADDDGEWRRAARPSERVTIARPSLPPADPSPVPGAGGDRSGGGALLVVAGVAVIGVVIALLLVLGLALDDGDDGSASLRGDRVSSHELRRGDCFTEPDADRDLTNFHREVVVVACDGQQQADVLSTHESSASVYPGVGFLWSQADQRCDPASSSWFFPRLEQWADGQRLTVCFRERGRGAIAGDATAGAQSSSRSARPGDVVSTRDLRLGDCFNHPDGRPFATTELRRVVLVPCDGQEQAEVLSTPRFSDSRVYPGEGFLLSEARQRCDSQSTFWFVPSQADWLDGEMRAVCFREREATPESPASAATTDDDAEAADAEAAAPDPPDDAAGSRQFADVNTADLGPLDCFNALEAATVTTSAHQLVRRVPCDGAEQGQVLSKHRLANTRLRPDVAALNAAARARCDDRVSGWSYPSSDDWHEGDRDIVCFREQSAEP